MSEVTFAIMAHPSRKHLVGPLEKKLPAGTQTIWDEKNDRWDTGRRALMAHPPAGDNGWHVVVQDDAVLCRKFVGGVEAALAQVPGNPVSFYAGKVRPHGTEVKLAIARAKEHDKNWFSMAGPLWGVCLAIPTLTIPHLIAAVEGSQTPNYDMRMAEYFVSIDTPCWYSIPSLVDHRVGPDNPSLVHGRSSGARRVAHSFIGRKDPTKIDWDSGCMPWMDLTKRKWAIARHGYQCGGCGTVFANLASVINHNFKRHNLGRVDFIATTPESDHMMSRIRYDLYPEARGELYVIGRGGISTLKAKRVLSRTPKRFTVVDSYQALRYVGERRSWSMDNKAEING